MSRNQVRLLFVVLLVFAVFLTGCQRKPGLPTVSRDEIKGSPRFGTPIGIMVPFHDELLAPGDEVLVFAEYAGERRSGTWKQDAYFSIEGVRGIYMKVGEQYLNIDSGQPCQSP